MKVPLQVTIRHMLPSPALEDRIREEAAKLELFHNRIVSCHVVVAEQALHKHQGRRFNVRIVLRVPGHELVVDHDHDEDVYLALRDAFASLTRRLEDVVRRQRGHDKAPGTQSPG
jgi:ribosomal subunit interface protein